MKRLALACGTFLVVLLAWLWLQIGVPHYAPSFGFTLPNPLIARGCLDSHPPNSANTCTCDTVNHTQFGFPVRWTGYGSCQDGEKQAAKMLDIALGLLLSSGAAVLIIMHRNIKNGDGAWR